jgi:hypothetical protein
MEKENKGFLLLKILTGLRKHNNYLAASNKK